MTDDNPGNRPFLYRPKTSDEAVIRQIFHNKDYDLSRLRRGGEIIAYWQAKTRIGKRPLIVDAGANIGAASIYFHRMFPDASIVAVEPEQENFKILSMNADGLPISCLNAAVTSRPGRIRLCDPGEGNWGFRTELLTGESTDHVSLESVQIGQIFNMQSEDIYPLIVKIDIEGAEEELFSGNVEWIVETPLIVIELHDWLMPKRQTSRNFLRAVAALDRDFVYLGENIFSIDNHFSGA